MGYRGSGHPPEGDGLASEEKSQVAGSQENGGGFFSDSYRKPGISPAQTAYGSFEVQRYPAGRRLA